MAVIPSTAVLHSRRIFGLFVKTYGEMVIRPLPHRRVIIYISSSSHGGLPAPVQSARPQWLGVGWGVQSRLRGRTGRRRSCHVALMPRTGRCRVRGKHRPPADGRDTCPTAARLRPVLAPDRTRRSRTTPMAPTAAAPLQAPPPARHCPYTPMMARQMTLPARCRRMFVLCGKLMLFP